MSEPLEGFWAEVCGGTMLCIKNPPDHIFATNEGAIAAMIIPNKSRTRFRVVVGGGEEITAGHGITYGTYRSMGDAQQALIEATGVKIVPEPTEKRQSVNA